MDDSIPERGGDQEGASSTKSADLDRRPRLEPPDEPVEVRRLVEAKRSHPVPEDAAGEQEREVLETGDSLGPAADVSEVGAAPLPVGNDELRQQSAQHSWKRQTPQERWGHAAHGTTALSRSRW